MSGVKVGWEDVALEFVELMTMTMVLAEQMEMTELLTMTIWVFMVAQDSSIPAYLNAGVHSMFIIRGVCFLLLQTVDPPPFSVLNAAIFWSVVRLSPCLPSSSFETPSGR